MTDIQGIILAAGKGTRMYSNIPKVLHTVSDKTLLEHVLNKAHKVCNKIHVVYGFKGEQVKSSI
ncbi:MAG TPA: bifunctional N-acetylglucosamine-1-phosphate uridyltransferase/glucosamine-1-phosphate acetyltransferase, partial [Gammaproteobacteria bacterium]|nr:bifunctional N-acetylglucosamine-1-phosphate uridyltransferase/glucosamine-1-phosphate acetyltransferase [Gammaproteobacteria bacterium]